MHSLRTCVVRVLLQFGTADCVQLTWCTGCTVHQLVWQLRFCYDRGQVDVKQKVLVAWLLHDRTVAAVSQCGRLLGLQDCQLLV